MQVRNTQRCNSAATWVGETRAVHEQVRFELWLWTENKLSNSYIYNKDILLGQLYSYWYESMLAGFIYTMLKKCSTWNKSILRCLADVLNICRIWQRIYTFERVGSLFELTVELRRHCNCVISCLAYKSAYFLPFEDCDAWHQTYTL